MKIFALLCSFILSGRVTFANDCIANPPVASVNNQASQISEYKFSYRPIEQIATELFNLREVGKVLVMFESCQHLVFTVVFLKNEPFNQKMTERERYTMFIQSLQKIPFKHDGRFIQLLHDVTSWAQIPLKEENIRSDSYFSWRHSDEAFSDYVLRNDTKNSGSGSRIRFDLNISL